MGIIYDVNYLGQNIQVKSIDGKYVALVNGATVFEDSDLCTLEMRLEAYFEEVNALKK